MARTARTVVEGIPHHVTQRGNNRQDVFFVDGDYEVYLEVLKKQAGKYGLTILGYCLMPNHVHLIVLPHGAEALAQAVGRAHFIYTQYINRLHGRCGHLWQGRFYSCALGDVRLMTAMRYVERNPVRAGLCRKPWLYAWSSAKAHLDPQVPSDLLDQRMWFGLAEASDWRQYLERVEDDDLLKTVRCHTRLGRPLGSDLFISKLEASLGRRLRPLPVGRPSKTRKTRRAAIPH